MKTSASGYRSGSRVTKAKITIPIARVVPGLTLVYDAIEIYCYRGAGRNSVLSPVNLKVKSSPSYKQR